MNLNRRSFLKRSLLSGGALSAGFLIAPRLFGAEAPSKKLNCVQIGCGGRGMDHLDWIVNRSKDNLMAIADPDEKRHAAVVKWLQSKQIDSGQLRFYTDYRRLFDELGRELDAVFVATPNHHHAGPSMLAMNLNKGVFCEKPLCHDVAEARKLRAMAAKSKAPTQMGNQGHCEEGYRRLCEFVWAGVIGPITETHSWTDRANGGQGPRPAPTPVPEGLHWDEWIGPAPFRKFHTDLHPHEWHGWYDFGNGSLGNMGCHVLDGAYWSLKLQDPVSIELEDVNGGTKERAPLGARIRYDFPARGSMPPVKVYWYEGLAKGADTPTDKLRTAKGAARNLPPLLAELQKQYPDEVFDSNGTLYVGEKGVLYTNTYGGRMRLVPMEKMSQIEQPPRTLPRPKNVVTDFLDACRSGVKETAASFDYASRLTEFILLGNLAQRAGVGKKLEWDPAAMKVKNLRAANAWLQRKPRKGWPG